MMFFASLNLAYFTHQLEGELKNAFYYSCASFEASVEHEHYRVRRFCDLCFFDRRLACIRVSMMVHVIVSRLVLMMRHIREFLNKLRCKSMPIIFYKLMQMLW